MGAALGSLAHSPLHSLTKYFVSLYFFSGCDGDSLLVLKKTFDIKALGAGGKLGGFSLKHWERGWSEGDW